MDFAGALCVASANRRFEVAARQRSLTDVHTKLSNQWPNSRIGELLPWAWKSSNIKADLTA